MLLFLIVVLAAVIFEYSSGFRDRARELVGDQMERRCLAESNCADDHFADRRIHSWRTGDVSAVRSSPPVDAFFHPSVLWKGTNRERSLDGAQPRYQRRPKN